MAGPSANLFNTFLLELTGQYLDRESRGYMRYADRRFVRPMNRIYPDSNLRENRRPIETPEIIIGELQLENTRHLPDESVVGDIQMRNAGNVQYNNRLQLNQSNIRMLSLLVTTNYTLDKMLSDIRYYNRLLQTTQWAIWRMKGQMYPGMPFPYDPNNSLHFEDMVELRSDAVMLISHNSSIDPRMLLLTESSNLSQIAVFLDVRLGPVNWGPNQVPPEWHNMWRQLARVPEALFVRFRHRMFNGAYMSTLSSPESMQVFSAEHCFFWETIFTPCGALFLTISHILRYTDMNTQQLRRFYPTQQMYIRLDLQAQSPNLRDFSSRYEFDRGPYRMRLQFTYHLTHFNHASEIKAFLQSLQTMCLGDQHSVDKIVVDFRASNMPRILDVFELFSSLKLKRIKHHTRLGIFFVLHRSDFEQIQNPIAVNEDTRNALKLFLHSPGLWPQNNRYTFVIPRRDDEDGTPTRWRGYNVEYFNEVPDDDGRILIAGAGGVNWFYLPPEGIRVL